MEWQGANALDEWSWHMSDERPDEPEGDVA
jgi:hypothetical protein